MKSIALVTLLLVAVLVVQAQSDITTIILVRHAERAEDGSRNPDISEAGKVRAQALANLFSQTKIDVIYSTAFKRTQNTVAPLAGLKMLAVQDYDPTSPWWVDEMLVKHKGQTVFCVGHSNTVPAMINQLTGKEEYKNFADSDYGNVVIVSLREKGSAKLTWLRY
jgi:2,3-bisphosphoglycerate-dependent phosphoglycerate mutase